MQSLMIVGREEPLIESRYIHIDVIAHSVYK